MFDLFFLLLRVVVVVVVVVVFDYGFGCGCIPLVVNAHSAPVLMTMMATFFYQAFTNNADINNGEEEEEEEEEPTTLEGLLAQYHDFNINLSHLLNSQNGTRRRKKIPQTQSGLTLDKSQLPPLEDPSHVDFGGVDLRRCWGRWLPTDNKVFYDKPERVANIENAASGPSEAYGADGKARIVSRGWLFV